MKTFAKSSNVIRVIYEEYTLEYKRAKLRKILDRYVELHQPYASLNTCFI